MCYMNLIQTIWSVVEKILQLYWTDAQQTEDKFQNFKKYFIMVLLTNFETPHFSQKSMMGDKVVPLFFIIY